MGSQWGLWPHGPDAAAMLKAEAQHTAWAQRHGVGGEHRWERGGIAWGGQRGQGGRQQTYRAANGAAVGQQWGFKGVSMGQPMEIQWGTNGVSVGSPMGQQ